MPRGRGKRLERLLEYMHQIYRNRGEADIEKKQLATTLDRRSGRVVYLARSGFDYDGCIKGGRNICMEAKETTDTDRLPIDPKGKHGLKIHQIEGLFRRAKLGALVGVIWMTDYDSAYIIGYKNLRRFLDTIYDRPGPNGRPVKSISLAFVKDNCPSVMNDGLVDYLGPAQEEEKDESQTNEDVRGANDATRRPATHSDDQKTTGRSMETDKQPRQKEGVDRSDYQLIESRGAQGVQGMPNVPPEDQSGGTKVPSDQRDGRHPFRDGSHRER